MRAQFGLTLVEILVTLAIAAILIAAAAPAMTEWVVNNRIRSATESIANGLRLAHAEAIRRNAPVTFQLTNGSNPDWRVQTVVGSQIIQQFASAETADANTLTVTRTPTSLAIVRFNGLGRSVPPTPPSTNVITQLDVNSTQLDAARRRPLRLVISAGGAIRMCDPSPALAGLSPPDPRAC
jgi:type IV fimbrial biogenesis protein FimT